MMPGNAIRRHPIVEERMRALADFAETTPLNRLESGTDTSVGIITASTSYQYVKEVCGGRYPVLKLGMVWPLPEKKLLDFAAGVEKLVVVEELDGFIETFCREIGLEVTGKDVFPLLGEFSQTLVAEKLGIPHEKGAALDEAIPPRPPSCARAAPTGDCFIH